MSDCHIYSTYCFWGLSLLQISEAVDPHLARGEGVAPGHNTCALVAIVGLFDDGGKLMLVLGALIVFSAVVSLGGFVSMDQPIRIAMVIVSIILTLIYGFEISYVFALQARFENKVMTTIVNALVISIGNFPKSFGMLLMTGALVALGCYIWGLIPLFIILEFSFVTFFSSKILLSIFAKMGDDEAAGKDQTAQSEEE